MTDEIAQPIYRIRAAERVIREHADQAGKPENSHPYGDKMLPAATTPEAYAGLMREYLGGPWGNQAALWHPLVALAVADWLHQAAMDVWAHGPMCECGTGCDACDDNLWEPHARAALALADLIVPPGERNGGEGS